VCWCATAAELATTWSLYAAKSPALIDGPLRCRRRPQIYGFLMPSDLAFKTMDVVHRAVLIWDVSRVPPTAPLTSDHPLSIL